MPRTAEQNEIIRNERMNNILISSLYLFASKGYDATTLDEIAKDTGCSHGLLYHYFKDKYTLYSYLINEIAFPIVHDNLNVISTNQKAKFVIQDLFNTFLKGFKSTNDQFAWAISLLTSVDITIVEGTKTVRVSKEKNDRIFNWLLKIIERGKEEGDIPAFKNSRELTATIIYFMKGMAYIRMKLGHKKFICPDVQILMGMIF